MDFILQQNSSAEPVADQSGTINLRDWKAAGSLQATPHYPIKLPSGTIVEVSIQPEPPSKEIIELSDEDLEWASTQGNFPTIDAVMYLRGLTSQVSYIAPLLSFGEFFKEHADALTAPIEKNISNKSKGTEWVEYYAAELHDFPIFSVLINNLSDKARSKVGAEYFRQFTDIKYLSPEQVQALTTEDKINVLKTAVAKYPGNDSKLSLAVGLFTEEDSIPAQDAALVLSYTRSSVDSGRLMACAAFYNDYTNAYNVVATWVRHCINERIGTNQSVWYKAALDLEVEHNFSLAGDYIKNLQGQPIGLNQTKSTLGGVSGGFKSMYSNNQPIGL